MDTINFYNKHSKTDAYTQKTYPLHRKNNTNFDDENGIVTWADEIDYGKIENFGWPGSNTTIDNTYSSLLEALERNFRYLYNEIQALKNDGSVTIELTRSNYQGTPNPSIITATVQNGNANETSWRISQKPGTTTWLTADTLGTIPPFGISVNSGNPNLVNTSVNNASSIFIGYYYGNGKEVYDPYQRLITSISILNNHGSNFTGANDSAVFKVNIDSTPSKSYTAVVTATNREVTSTYDMTRTVNGLAPTSYLWQIAKNENSGAIRGTDINNGVDATFTYSEYGIQFTIKNNKTSQATLICPENNTGSDIEFYVRCRVTYEDDSTNYKSIKCILKTQTQQTAYYWYVGQDHPSENTTIVTDNNSPGWRLTGSTIDADYEFNTTDNGISDDPTRREEWYIALPVGSPYHIWDDAYSEQFDTYYATGETVDFRNVTYNIFKPGTSARILGGQLIKK